MSRINTNVTSLTAQRVLGQNNKKLGVSLERLSTGLRISRGKDDPAGLIASENLRSEKAGINAALKNSQRADQVVNIAEGGLQEVSSLLTELQGLVTTSANSAGLSSSEKDANQLQIDSILQTIDRVSGATSFQGSKLLNGNLDYQVNAVDAGVTDINIRGAKFNTATQAVSAVVTASAQQGGLLLSIGAATLDLNNTGGSFTIEIAGSLGNRELQFASGDTVASIASAINGVSDVTGVTASSAGNTVAIASSEFGSNEFVSIDVIDEASLNTAYAAANIADYAASDFGNVTGGTIVKTFVSTEAANGIRDDGQDIAGTINGLLATGDGKSLSVNSDFLDVQFSTSTGASQTLGSLAAFTITGGGADFQLAADVSIAGKVSIGIGDISARKLGTSALGHLDDLASGKSFNVVDGNNINTAQKIIAAAIKQVSSTRGRLGAFQKNVVGTTTRSLGVALENTTAAESVIRDTDFASETASLTRSQILVQASTNVLSLANQQPQQVLALLG